MKTEPTEALSWIERRKSLNNHVFTVLLSESETGCRLAFQEGQSNPKIKQLEWKYDEEFFIWEANSVFGKYSFVDNSKIVNKKLFFRGKVIAIVLTIDAAKAAAQEHFEKKVKECLE